MGWIDSSCNCQLCGKEIKNISSSGYIMSKLSGKIYPDITKYKLDGERGDYFFICKDCAKSYIEEQKKLNEGKRKTITLIKCPDCGNSVSKRATIYPQCGCPIGEIIAEQTEILRPASLNSNIPKCPTCQSTNVEKISLKSKIGKVALVGIFAIGKVSKTFKCNACGYRW